MKILEKVAKGMQNMMYQNLRGLDIDSDTMLDLAQAALDAAGVIILPKDAELEVGDVISYEDGDCHRAGIMVGSSKKSPDIFLDWDCANSYEIEFCKIIKRGDNLVKQESDDA